MTVRDVIRAAGNAAILSGQILIIVAAASVVTWMLTTQGVPQAISPGSTLCSLAPRRFCCRKLSAAGGRLLP
jgi:TRAP-type C4-dicarboxylate transport system permease large subunit